MKRRRRVEVIQSTSIKQVRPVAVFLSDIYTVQEIRDRREKKRIDGNIKTRIEIEDWKWRNDSRDGIMRAWSFANDESHIVMVLVL